jgi:hypothetical protein
MHKPVFFMKMPPSFISFLQLEKVIVNVSGIDEWV